MSSELTIDCPHCGKGFELTEALAGPLLIAERKRARGDAQKTIESERSAIEATARKAAEDEFATQLLARDAEIADRDAKVVQAQRAELVARKATEEAQRAKQEAELDVQRRIDAEREKIATEAATKATVAVNAKLAAAEATIAEKDTKLAEAQAEEIEARRLKAAADDTLREAELTVSRRLDEERTKVREQALHERDDEYRLKLGDKDAQLRSMQDQIEELRRKGAVTSQQLVGDVLEVDLLATLQEAFPTDRFERVRKGQRGADVLQTVISGGGSSCGKILWESKRTKNWSEPWLAKLREDQRDAQADIAALATETLPDGVSSFDEREGVWVTPLSTIVPVAAALRRLLIDVATARRAGALADSKKDHVFTYLTSPQFRQRVSRVVEGYEEMRADLDREKRATATAWSKREKQLDRILGGMTGFYGDLQGLVGTSLPGIEGLMLSGPEDTSEKPKLTIVGTGSGNTDAAVADPLLS